MILAAVAFLVGKLKMRYRNAINIRATTPTSPTINAVLFISCSGVFSEKVSSDVCCKSSVLAFSGFGFCGQWLLCGSGLKGGC